MDACLDGWINGIHRDNVMIWKCFLRHWPSARGNHRWVFLKKGQERGLRYWLFVREPIGHWWIPLTKGQERWCWCLPKEQLSKQSSWVTGDLRHQCIDINVIFICLKMWLFCFEDVQTDPNTMYERIMACRWPAPSHYLNQRWYILSIGPLQTNFSENIIEIYLFSFKKMHLIKSSRKWPPFCLGLNALIWIKFSC